MRKLILFISILFVSAIMYGQTDVVRNYTKPYFVKNVKVNDTLGTKRLIVTYGADTDKILRSDTVGMATWVTATSIVPADTFYFDYCNGCAGVVGWKHIGDTIYADTSVLATTFRLDSLTSSVYDSLSAHRVILNYYINDSANLVHWSDTSVVATKYDLDTMKYFPQLFTDSLGGYLNCIDIAYIHQIIGCSPVDFPTGITVSNIGTSSNYVDTAYISKAYIQYLHVKDSLIYTNGAGVGKVLTSDVNGYATWQTINNTCPAANAGEKLLFVNGCLYVADSNEKAIDGVTDTTFTWNDAKLRCQGLGTGWYLPNKFELDIIYQNWNQPANNGNGNCNGGACILTGFSSTGYWSSTVFDTTYAWRQSFDTGSQYDTNKTITCNVRCVRR